MASMNVLRFYPPGGLDKLKHEKSPVPDQLGDGQVLVKVRAASMIWTELSWPIYQRQDGSYVPHIVCHDFSGTVTRTGPRVESSGIYVGSEVYAFTTGMTEEGLRNCEGAAAEYAIADVNSILPKPKTLSLLEAASVPLSALTAWQALHDHAQLKKGQRLLITGAGGATGLSAVQMAKLVGTHVIGTASSPRSFEMLNELGIDEIIDYKKPNLEDAVSDVDLVLDNVGGNVLLQCAKVVKKDGTILSLVDYDVQEKVPNVKALFYIVETKLDQFKEITRLIEESKMKTFIDIVFPFDKATEAFKKGLKGHTNGKILLEISS